MYYSYQNQRPTSKGGGREYREGKRGGEGREGVERGGVEEREGGEGEWEGRKGTGFYGS